MRCVRDQRRSKTEQHRLQGEMHKMIDKKVWFITGAGRGMGAEFAKAVLPAGHSLVATGRDQARLAQTLGRSTELLTVKLDVTQPNNAEAAVTAAVERSG